MTPNRHDTILNTLGDRTDRSLWRLWIENSCDRLTRNGFPAETALAIERRPGNGINIRTSALGSCHVHSRRGVPLLSVEKSYLLDHFGTPELRAKISYGLIVVVPRLRNFTIPKLRTETWTISGLSMDTQSGPVSIKTATPLVIPQRAQRIVANLNEDNLVYTTEIIGNQKPEFINLSGDELLVLIADQFLRSCGYSTTATPFEYSR